MIYKEGDILHESENLTHPGCAYNSRWLDIDGSGSMEMDNRAFNKTLNKDILNTTYLSNNNKAFKYLLK